MPDRIAEYMSQRMPENMPDRKPLQMKTCFESLPTLEISDEKMEKSRGHSTKTTFFFGKSMNIPIFEGKTHHYCGPCSVAMLNDQRVFLGCWKQS